MVEFKVRTLDGQTHDFKLSDEVRAERFRKQLVETFDLPAIGRFVLGRYWRLASKQQRSEYLSLFEDYLVQTYPVRLKGLRGKFRVNRVYEIKPRDVLVLTEVELSKGKPVRINWRVRGPIQEKFQIVDVVIEGISMSVTQRDEFAAVINRRGGNLEGLLAELRKKTQKSR